MQRFELEHVASEQARVGIKVMPPWFVYEQRSQSYFKIGILLEPLNLKRIFNLRI